MSQLGALANNLSFTSSETLAVGFSSYQSHHCWPLFSGYRHINDALHNVNNFHHFLTGLIFPLCFLHCLFDSSSGSHKTCLLTSSRIPSLQGRSNILVRKPFLVHYRPKLVSKTQHNRQKERQHALRIQVSSLRASHRRLQPAKAHCPSKAHTAAPLPESSHPSTQTHCQCAHIHEHIFFIEVNFTKHK